MTQRTIPNSLSLENVPMKLRNVRNILPSDFPKVILDFSEYMANIAMKKIKYHCNFSPETMWILTFEAKYYIEGTREAILPVPKKLEGKMPKILKNINSFYLLIEKISSEDFSKKFKGLSLIDKNV